jgi:outer membrane protein OmpA-like peptidoglycan-associated protein
MPIDSPLSFLNTSTFRDSLVVRNLQPYTIAGAFTPPVAEQNYEYNQNNFSVVDSPNGLIDDPPSNLIPPQFHGLYVLNEYGPQGGYGVTITQSQPLVQNANGGEYTVMDASLPEQSLVGQGWPSFAQVSAEQNIPSLNKYSFDEVFLETINNIQFVPTFTFYANPNPISFVPSTYSPYDILGSDNPQGSDGSVSQDSMLAQLSATFLRDAFQYRIDREIERNTSGRENLTEALQDPVFAQQVAAGRRPLIDLNYRITVAANPVVAGADFLLRLSGTYYPSSVIPGDYFDEDMAQWRPTALNQITSAFGGGKDPRETAIGKFFGLLKNDTNPSQLFLNNTSFGQRSLLFNSIDYNKYKPRYDRGALRNLGRGILEGIENLLDGEQAPPSDFYIGANNSDPSDIFSPPGQLPINSVGQQVKSPVVGPDVMGKLYEGEDQNFKFGLAGKTTIDAGGITGGFTWTSTKYNNAGFKATVGGDAASTQDSEFNQISSQFDGSSVSTNIDFRNDSILDNTQRLLESTPEGAARLSHVGNAINQLSKVFHDGYKEMTKGSKVVSYTYDAATNKHGGGVEYCRVFTKDTPYYTFADLQKTDGITNAGRKFTYSIVDSSYNLNIAPLKNPGSTNIKDNKVKKYMFSIENLAWRTSNRPGFTYDDLPVCERGPNGGRVMWFPPYDLTFSETISPRFDGIEVLGRPEPIYTYRSTTRGGSLSWKMVVDHPSVLNTITNKILQNESNTEKVNSIVDSFFAGCVKYDLYELARRFTTIPTRDLFVYQQIITNPSANADQIATAAQEAGVVVTNSEGGELGGNNDSSANNNTNTTNPGNELASKWVNLGWYFHNDQPNPNTRITKTDVNWLSTYTDYLGRETEYLDKSTIKPQTQEEKQLAKQRVEFTFKNVVEYNRTESDAFVKELFDFMEQNPKVTKIILKLRGSASAPASQGYNVNLSQRRISSVENYLKSTVLGKYMSDAAERKIVVEPNGKGEEETESQPKVKSDSGANIPTALQSCTDADTGVTGYDKIYSYQAMWCRRVAIQEIKVEGQPGGDTPQGNPTTDTVVTNPQETLVPPPPVVPPTITTTQKIREGISKKILRDLLSECDYFTAIQQENPMIYDSIKQKLKYFHPAFHSMTPEGLNSRLTFLNQCSRPGDTIPTIGTDGKPKYSSATNTAFGAPPVLILRIGDFYNTRIIPESIGITYENLFDFNPEGIGFQPMIAKINMTFKFVGGSGLKEPIDTLQNALSFNYYANTEIFDERAEWTDDSFKKLDEDLVKKILSDRNESSGATTVQNAVQNNGGTYLGVVESSNATGGTLNYKKLFDETFDSAQNYVNAFITYLTDTSLIYNDVILKIATSKQLYSKGKVQPYNDEMPLQILGKTDSIQTSVDGMISSLITAVEDESLSYQNNDVYKNIVKRKDRKKINSNFVNFLNTYKIDFTTDISKYIQSSIEQQQSMVLFFEKMDLVSGSYDGQIKSDQSVELLSISGIGGSDDKLKADYKTITDNLNNFYTSISGTGLLGNVNYKTTDTNFAILDLTNQDALFVVIMSKYLGNDAELTDLTKKLTENIEDSNDRTTAQIELKVRFESYKVYLTEITKAQQKIKTWSDSAEGQTYLKLDTSIKNVDRKYNYAIIPADGTWKDRLLNIYKTGNSNEDKSTFNGKHKFN